MVMAMVIIGRIQDGIASRVQGWPGVFIIGATTPDYCPNVFGNSTANGYFGCLDADGNGVADLFEQNQTDDTDDSNDNTTRPIQH